MEFAKALPINSIASALPFPASLFGAIPAFSTAYSLYNLYNQLSQSPSSSIPFSSYNSPKFPSPGSSPDPITPAVRLRHGSPKDWTYTSTKTAVETRKRRKTLSSRWAYKRRSKKNWFL